MHVGHETVPLTGGGHLLHWVDLHHLILQHTGSEELVHDLILLDRQGVEVDVLDGVQLPFLYQAPQLGARHPVLLLHLALTLVSLLTTLLTLALIAKATLTEAAFTLS